MNSLAYEAEARLRDPVYGCIGAIALLQRKMIELQQDLAVARARLARYTTPAASSCAVLNDRSFNLRIVVLFLAIFLCDSLELFLTCRNYTFNNVKGGKPNAAVEKRQ